MRHRSQAIPWTLIVLGALAGCRGAATPTVNMAQGPSIAQATHARPPSVAPRPAQPATDHEPSIAQASDVTPVAFTEPIQAPPPSPPLPGVSPPPGASAAATVENFPIDLPTALRLAQGGNLQVAFAREQINEAWARAEAAQALWLPSIRGGLGYNKHEGQIQDIVGSVFPKSRGNVWSGLGASVPGAGSPAYPGISANFQLADALFEPLAARQGAAVRRHAADAVGNDVLLAVALGYLDLARAAEEVAIAEATVANHESLVRLTEAYAASGQGAPLEADRANTELSLRRNDLLRAHEAYRVASARLAQRLRINAEVLLNPIDPVTVPVDLVPPGVAPGELVAQGLALRPELAESRHLVSQAVQKMRREQYAVLMPSILLGMSYGGFGGGQGQTIANYGNRMDADAIAFWQLRNLGVGDRAARAEASSLVRQANVRHLALFDQVAREVIEAHAQVEMRRQQIAIAERGIETAKLSYERNLDRIQQGQGLPIELLQAMQALSQARRDYLRTLIDYNTAQFTLYRAIGAPGKFTEYSVGSDAS